MVKFVYMEYVETLVKHLQTVGQVGLAKMADVSSSVQSCVLPIKPVYKDTVLCHVRYVCYTVYHQ